jgi:hypothetical protein
MDVSPDSVVAQLLGELRLDEQEIVVRLEQATDEQYWSRLIPWLSVHGAQRRVTEQAPLDEAALSDLRLRMETDGYFQLPPLFSRADIDRMRAGVDALRAAGWPPAFAFVFDEFWDLVRTPSVVQLFETALGAGHRQNAHVWCHYVAPVSGSSGWIPHIDGRNRPNRMSIWIPLTDVGLDDGCMYVVSRRGMPERLGTVGISSVTWPELRGALHRTRALPAHAGSVLGWAFDVMHWGAMTGRPAGPRISVALEFLGPHAEPFDDEQPLVDGRSREADLRLRLLCIAKSLLLYHAFEPGANRYRGLAERLIEP